MVIPYIYVLHTYIHVNKCRPLIPASIVQHSTLISTPSRLYLYHAATEGLEGRQSPAIIPARARNRRIQRIHEAEAVLLAYAEAAIPA